ncbi:inositol monophosphatase family protein [soil metagenome]
MSEPSPLLLELGKIVRRAGALAQKEREKMVSEFKPDGSIVTNADRNVELFLRDELPKLIPGTGIWGEEFPWDEPMAAGNWAVDPVDGTSNFSFGGLVWGVTVGLMQEGKCVTGAIFLPDLGEVYLAQKGEGAWLNGKLIPQIKPGAINDHELVSYDDMLVRRYPDVRIPGKMRCYGAFVVDATFTANQRFRGMIGRRESLYDIAASVLVLEEAGAEIRYADGTEFLLSELCDGQNITKPWLMFPPNNGFYLEAHPSS